MRCSAICTAEKYFLKKIANFYRTQGFYYKTHRDVLYIFNLDKTKEIFFLNIGSFVSWNFTNREEKMIAQQIHSFSANPYKEMEKDHFIFQYNSETQITTDERFNADIIFLEDQDFQIKLAISYGLAQSVKLEVYEDKVQSVIKLNSHLPLEMAQFGKITLSGKAISKRMGEIFLVKSLVNLNSEYLDMPEYFWKYPSLENYYLMTEKFLDIPPRVETLNQKLDVLHDLLNILTSQLQHRHSNFLETIIIVLIALEIVINLFARFK